MKKFTLLLLLFLAGNSAFAQSTTWSWTQYNISFTLPNILGIESNTAEEFIAADEYMEFGIYPFNDDEVSTEDIGAYTEAIGYMLELGNQSESEDLELNGFHGSIVEGVVDGMRVVVLGLIDPDGATNFYATTTFEDGDDESLEIAVQILRSISKK